MDAEVDAEEPAPQAGEVARGEAGEAAAGVAAGAEGIAEHQGLGSGSWTMVCHPRSVQSIRVRARCRASSDRTLSTYRTRLGLSHRRRRQAATLSHWDLARASGLWRRLKPALRMLRRRPHETRSMPPDLRDRMRPSHSGLQALMFILVRHRPPPLKQARIWLARMPLTLALALAIPPHPSPPRLTPVLPQIRGIDPSLHPGAQSHYAV